jgi:nucleotide-binding universal stress UspA family protein
MSKPLKTMVIGTSLTEASDGVVKTGVALARATGASLWLVHAYVPLGAYGGNMDALWMEEQVKSLRELIAEQARRTGLADLAGFSPGQVRLVVGSPHREIVDLVRRVHADLVILGAAESIGILGSTTDRVIRKVSCPVLAIRSAEAFPPTRVEIPVDLSPISAHALRQGLGFLAQIGFPVAETEALFILNPFEVGGSIAFSPEQIRRFAGEELSRFLAANTPEGGRPAMQIRTGYPREEILAALAETGADLAVLGTHGRNGFERLMVGSVAAGVLRGAKCNLLVIPPAAAAGTHEELTGADWSYISDEAAVAAGQF